LVLVLLCAKQASADYKDILGVSTDSPTLSLPPTVEGPGLILPNSPLFFLDELKQNIRLLLAFTPEAKAKVYAEVAGERLAELRFMLAAKDQKGIEIALKGIQENLNKAGDMLQAAKLQGRTVSNLAVELNNNIKNKQEMLDILENQAEGGEKAKVQLAQKALLQAKIKVEDSLPEAELEKAIKEDLERHIERELRESSESAKTAAEALLELQKEASESAQKALDARQKALEKAIEERNETLKEVQKRLLEQEKKRQEKLMEVQEKVSEQAREAIQKAQEAAKGLRQAQLELKRITIEEPQKITPSIVPPQIKSSLQETKSGSKTETKSIELKTESTSKESKGE
jgi:hypothetical protein